MWKIYLLIKFNQAAREAEKTFSIIVMQMQPYFSN